MSVPTRVSNVKQARINPDLEIDIPVRLTIQGSIVPQQVDVNPIMEKAMEAQANPRVVNSRELSISFCLDSSATRKD